MVSLPFAHVAAHMISFRRVCKHAGKDWRTEKMKEHNSLNPLPPRWNLGNGKWIRKGTRRTGMS